MRAVRRRRVHVQVEDQSVLADLQVRSLPAGTQYWIFALFAAAFIVKAPLFPVHGWLPDTYRATPIPVLVLLSGVLSKVMRCPIGS